MMRHIAIVVRDYWLAARLIGLGILLMIHSALPAQELPQGELKALDTKIQTIMEEHNIPSIAFAIVRHGQVPHLRAFGKANTESNAETSLETPYRIASISKMIVAIAVMQLVEAGELSLDDKVSQLLPDFEFSNRWSESHPLRLKHLLESTTGWGDISLKEFAYENNPPIDLTTALTINPSNRDSRWPPGTRHAYTNSAAAVAALVVETKTRMSFYSYAEQKIFRPLDMQSATYSKAEEKSATGYKNGQPVAYKSILMRPAGGLSVSVQDMAKLTQFYVNRGYRLLRAETIRGMEYANTVNVSPFAAGYGQFNYARFYNGIRYRGHDGMLPGWMSELSYSPKHNVGFVALQNSEQPVGFRAVVNAITEYLAKGFALNKYVAADIPDGWAAMSGYYRYQNPRVSKIFFLERLLSTNKLDVMTDKAVFRSTFPPGWRRELTYRGEDTWQNQQGEAVMKLGDDPVLGPVLHYGDRVFKPVSVFNAWVDKIVLIVWLVLLLSMLVHSIVWPIQRMRGKLSRPGASGVRLSVSVAVWSVALFTLCLGSGLVSAIERLGNIGFFSIGLFVTSWLIVVATMWASYQLFNVRNVYGPTAVYRFSFVYIALQWLVIAYLANFGVIGILSWT